MQKIISLFIVTLLGTTLLWSAPARGGVMSFTQADGSTFQGLLKGDASFHWIESDGEIVLFNRADSNYYKAKVVDGSLVMTEEKVTLKSSKKAAAFTEKAKENRHSVSQEKREALNMMHKNAQKGHHPR